MLTNISSQHTYFRLFTCTPHSSNVAESAAMRVQPLQAAPWPATTRAVPWQNPQPLGAAVLACRVISAHLVQPLPPWGANAAAATAAAAYRTRRLRAAAASSQGSIEETIAAVLELQLDVLPGSPQFEANVRYLSRLAGKWGVEVPGLVAALHACALLCPASPLSLPMPPMPHLHPLLQAGCTGSRV